MAKKILVIDDSALMRRVISDIINEGNEYEVAAIAKDGLEGFDLIVSNPNLYSAIILDINMPKMNGLELLQKLQKNHIEQTVIVVSTVAKEGAKVVIENNPNVDKIYEYKKDRKSIKKLSLEIAAEKYDLLIDFSEMLRVNQMMLINLCKARFNMGLNKENWKIFDISYTKPTGYIHVTEIYKNILEKLGIKNIDISYELFFIERQKSKIEELLKKLKHKKIVVFNPFAASKHRNINLENIVKIGKIILEDENNILMFIGEEKRKKELENVMRELGNNTFFPEFKDIMETSYLISKADLVITPDTSIVHISAAFKRKLIAIYRIDGKAENEINRYLWGPNYKEAVQIFSKDFAIKNGEEPDINKFDMKELENEIKKYLRKQEKI